MTVGIEDSQFPGEGSSFFRCLVIHIVSDMSLGLRVQLGVNICHMYLLMMKVTIQLGLGVVGVLYNLLLRWIGHISMVRYYKIPL